MAKKNIHHLTMIIDMAMIIVLPLLMGYSLVGEMAHELIGMIMAALMIVHLVLNRKWFAVIFRGKYTVRRVVTTSINLLLIVCVLASMVSGMMISKHIFTSVSIAGGASLMRTLHLLCSYWGFVIMSLHAGTHGGAMLSKLKRRNKQRNIALYTALVIVLIYGVYSFIKRGFWQYMFLISRFVFFDVNGPFVFFYVDHLAVMALFMAVGYFLIKLVGYGGRNKC